MPLTPHRTQHLSQLEESTRGTSDITGEGDNTYLFGIEERPVGNFPEIEITPHVTYYGDKREPGDFHVASYKSFANLMFCPTNALWWYYFLGGSITTSGTDVHTITPITSGELPTFTARKESSNATTQIRNNFSYGKLHTLSFGIDLRSPIQYGVHSMIMDWQKIIEGVAGYSITPSVPAGSSNECYRKASDMVFTWDYGGDNIDYKSVLLDFSYNGVNGTLAQLVGSQNYPKWLLEGNYVHGLNWTMHRGKDESLYDDFIAQLSNDVFKDLRFKIFQPDGVKYLQLDLGDVMILKTPQNKGFDKKQEDTVYMVNAWAKSLSVEAKDGITITTDAGLDHYQRDANYSS